MVARIANAVLFQLVWMACVGGGAAGRWWLGPAAALAFALWQVPRSLSPRGELTLLAVAVGIGMVVETAMITGGLLAYPSPGPWERVTPIWILALWANLALTLNHSLDWLKGRLVTAALLGAVAGPISYWVGASAWNAVVFTAGTPVVLGVLAAAWGIVTPVLVVLADRTHRSDRPLATAR